MRGRWSERTPGERGTFSQRTSTLGRDSSHSRVTLSFSVATVSCRGLLNLTGSSGWREARGESRARRA